MTPETFYAVTSAAALLAIAAELAYATRTGRRWHGRADTIANLNLAAGNVLLGVVLAGIVVGGYTTLHARRIADVPSMLPRGAALVSAIVLADFLQYWTHRLSHRWNLLWWGHVTHHSSSHFNLSTGIRVNWLYRSYAWLLYAPMPLLGFSLESFVVAQAVINVYNLFMHTRLNVRFGPLGWVLVTPLTHRLHHSANPRYFGNYGAALIVWDRLFGTYREASPTTPDEELAYGIGRNVDTADPLRLNFHYLRELWAAAREGKRGFLRLLFASTSATGGATASPSSPSADAEVPRAAWLGVAATATVAVGVNHLQARLSSGERAAAVGAGLAIVVAFGVFVGRNRLRARSAAASSPVSAGPSSFGIVGPKTPGTTAERRSDTMKLGA